MRAPDCPTELGRAGCQPAKISSQFNSGKCQPSIYVSSGPTSPPTTQHVSFLCLDSFVCQRLHRGNRGGQSIHSTHVCLLQTCEVLSTCRDLRHAILPLRHAYRHVPHCPQASIRLTCSPRLVRTYHTQLIPPLLTSRFSSFLWFTYQHSTPQHMSAYLSR